MQQRILAYIHICMNTRQKLAPIASGAARLCPRSSGKSDRNGPRLSIFLDTQREKWFHLSEDHTSVWGIDAVLTSMRKHDEESKNPDAFSSSLSKFSFTSACLERFVWRVCDTLRWKPHQRESYDRRAKAEPGNSLKPIVQPPGKLPTNLSIVHGNRQVTMHYRGSADRDAADRAAEAHSRHCRYRSVSPCEHDGVYV